MQRDVLVTLTTLAIAMACASNSFAQSAAPALAKYPAVFAANGGVRILVAPTADDKAALVRVSGINHPIDNVVFLAQKVGDGRRASFVVKLDGRDWNMVQSEDVSSWGDRYTDTQAYLPNERDGVRLRYDESASTAVDLMSLTRDYEKQYSEGVQAKLAIFDKVKAMSNAEARIKEDDTDASTACGAPIKTTVKWDSINEDQMKRLSIGGFCSTVANAQRRMCVDDAAFKSWATQHANITCQFGEKLNITNNGGTIVFTTTEDAPNPDDFVQQYLRNQ
jgi:hypothetical protein